MKKIENKTCKYVKLLGDKDVSYKDLIEYCITKVPAESLSADAIARIVRIYNGLEKMEFEDADYDMLKGFVKRASWGQPGVVLDIKVLQEIDQFVKDVWSTD